MQLFAQLTVVYVLDDGLVFFGLDLVGFGEVATLDHSVHWWSGFREV